MDLLGLLFSKAILVWMGIALLLILVPAHIVWLLERRHPNGIIPTDKYIPGIFYAMYWAAGTLATQSDQMPRQWLARVIAVFWMFTGVVFVAFYTAQLDRDADGPADPGRHQRAGRSAGQEGRDHPRQHRGQPAGRTARDRDRGRPDR